MSRSKKKVDEDGMQKNSAAEYLCIVFFSYNKLIKKQQYCVRIETAKHFSSLSYKLTIKSERKKGELDIQITGLIPDQTYLNLVKPAAADVYFDELFGDYKINVIKQDGSVNSAIYNFNIFKKEINLINEFETPEKNAQAFCTFYTAGDLNTFAQE